MTFYRIIKKELAEMKWVHLVFWPIEKNNNNNWYLANRYVWTSKWQFCEFKNGFAKKKKPKIHILVEKKDHTIQIVSLDAQIYKAKKKKKWKRSAKESQEQVM